MKQFTKQDMTDFADYLWLWYKPSRNLSWVRKQTVRDNPTAYSTETILNEWFSRIKRDEEAEIQNNIKEE